MAEPTGASSLPGDGSKLRRVVAGQLNGEPSKDGDDEAMSVQNDTVGAVASRSPAAARRAASPPLELALADIRARRRGLLAGLSGFVVAGALAALLAAGTVGGVAVAASPAHRVVETTRPGANRLLCGAGRGRLERLVVRRVDAFRLSDAHFSFPAVALVKARPSIMGIANVLCDLPALPRDALHCPADLGISFSARAATAAVIVDASGCEAVRGLTPVRRADARLWRALGTAMGVASPTERTFLGGPPAH
jgi:hypothetical protein